MTKNGHYDNANDKNNIEMSANTNTLKSKTFLKDNYEVDFRQDNSINSLLGFHRKLYTSGFHESEIMVNILTINSILVNIDIISGSYVNGSTQSTIYSFFPNVSPGYKIIENSHNLLYLPITSDTIHHSLANRSERKRAQLTKREFVNVISSEKKYRVLKMTSYTNVKVKISAGQKDKLKKHLNQIVSLSQFVSRLPI